MRGNEVIVGSAAGRRDAAVDNERDAGEEEVGVEESCDFFAACNVALVFRSDFFLYIARHETRPSHTNSSKLAPNVQYHNDRHDQCDNVRKAGGALEDDRVR